MVESGGSSKGCEARDWDRKAVDGVRAGERGLQTPAAAGYGGGTGTSGRCRAERSLQRGAGASLPPPTRVFFLLPDPLPSLASENCRVLTLLPVPD